MIPRKSSELQARKVYFHISALSTTATNFLHNCKRCVCVHVIVKSFFNAPLQPPAVENVYNPFTICNIAALYFVQALQDK